MALKKATKQPSKKKRAAPQNLSPDTTPVMQGGMPRALGIRVTSLSPRKVTAEMPIKPMHLNMNGRVNGGAIMAFADVLGALGAVCEPAAGLSRRHDRIEDEFLCFRRRPRAVRRLRASAHRPHDVGVADDDSERRRLEGRHGHSDADFGPGEGARSRIVKSG